MTTPKPAVQPDPVERVTRDVLAVLEPLRPFLANTPAVEDAVAETMERLVTALERGLTTAARASIEAPDFLRLPWHRETIGHKNVKQIAQKVARDLAVPLPSGIPPNTDATWIVNADNKVVAFIGNGPRQTENGDAIIAAVRLQGQPTERGEDGE